MILNGHYLVHRPTGAKPLGGIKNQGGLGTWAGKDENLGIILSWLLWLDRTID